MARRKILRAAVFVLGLLIILRSVAYIVRMGGDTKKRFAGFYAEPQDSIDVVMLGSSAVSESLIPAYMWDKYGFTSYPLSSNSQCPGVLKYLIKESLKYQTPKLFVVEMRTFVTSYEDQLKDEGHIREVVDNMRYSINRINAINALTEEFDDKLSFYFDIFKYHSNVGLLCSPSEWKMFNYSVDNDMKGYELKNGVMKYREKEENRASDAYCYDQKPIPVKQEEVLRDLLAYAKENELQMLFVVTPRDHDEEYEGNICYMKEIVNGYGFDLIDVNEDFEKAQFDYRFDMDDGAHTNLWGAVKTSDYVGKYIKEHCLGELNHKQRITDEWNDAYRYFEKVYNDTKAEEK